MRSRSGTRSLIGVCVSAGIFLSGRLIDRFGRRSPQVYGLLPGIALALAVPFFIGFVHTPSWPIALAFLAVPTFLNYFYLTPAVTLVQNSVSARQRTLAGRGAAAHHEPDRPGSRTHLGGCRERLAAADASCEFAAARLLQPGPFYLIAIVLHFVLARRLGRGREVVPWLDMSERRSSINRFAAGDATLCAHAGPLHRSRGQVARRRRSRDGRQWRGQRSHWVRSHA